ncbi:hypothetical protein GCM10017711_14060 [Paeniglutamicibacter sulfureus]
MGVVSLPEETAPIVLSPAVWTGWPCRLLEDQVSIGRELGEEIGKEIGLAPWPQAYRHGRGARAKTQAEVKDCCGVGSASGARGNQEPRFVPGDLTGFNRLCLAGILRATRGDHHM